MQRSYRTVRIVEIRNLFLGRLRHRVRAVEQEDRDLLVGLLADVHSPMYAVTRLFPLDLSRRNLDALTLAAIAAFNRDEIAAQDHGNAVKWIAMPRHGFAGRKSKPAHHGGSVMKEGFVRRCFAASPNREWDGNDVGIMRRCDQPAVGFLYQNASH